MNAYKCDGCKQYQNGEPLIEVHLMVYEWGEPNELHFCAWSCVAIHTNEVLTEQGATP